MTSATLSPAESGAVRPGPPDLSGVPDEVLAPLLRAKYRAVNRAQAELWAVMAETGLRTGHGERAEGPVPSSIEEIGPALTLTSSTAFVEHDTAERLRVDLPAVGAALWDGEIDRAKARVFVDWTRELTEEQRAVVVAELLPGASGWTVGQLAERLRRRIRTLDPGNERRRYAEARRARQVTGHLARDGSAVVTGSGLAPASAAASLTRIAHLARLVRRGGHPERIAQITADIYAGLLDGTFEGMDDAQIVQVVLDRLPPPAPSPGVEVRIRLSTLAGLDEHDSEIAGLGVVVAEAAREVVARQHDAAWRFTLVDPAGHLLLTGATRHRPPGAAPTRPVDRSPGVVELQVEITDLAVLAEAPPAGWERLLADLVEQWARRDELREQMDSDPDARFPAAALRRFVQTRDRTCVFPGCRCPAGRAQVDHSIEYQDGGLTVASNLGLLCLRHHRLKSVGGWSLDQPAPGRFDWTSALGRRYRTGGEPAVPPVDPPCPDLGRPPF